MNNNNNNYVSNNKINCYKKQVYSCINGKEHMRLLKSK